MVMSAICFERHVLLSGQWQRLHSWAKWHLHPISYLLPLPDGSTCSAITSNSASKVCEDGVRSCIVPIAAGRLVSTSMHCLRFRPVGRRVSEPYTLHDLWRNTLETSVNVLFGIRFLGVRCIVNCCLFSTTSLVSSRTMIPHDSLQSAEMELCSERNINASLTIDQLRRVFITRWGNTYFSSKYLGQRVCHVNKRVEVVITDLHYPRTRIVLSPLQKFIFTSQCNPVTSLLQFSRYHFVVGNLVRMFS